MTLIASTWTPGRWWRTRRVERTVRAFTSAPTSPMPVLGEVVHSVTASWGAGGWTLRFGPSGPATTVPRLTGAEPDARVLVAAALGMPPRSVRVRIVPDVGTVETVLALRRAGVARPPRRPVWRPGPDRV